MKIFVQKRTNFSLYKFDIYIYVLLYSNYKIMLIILLQTSGYIFYTNLSRIQITSATLITLKVLLKIYIFVIFFEIISFHNVYYFFVIKKQIILTNTCKSRKLQLFSRCFSSVVLNECAFGVRLTLYSVFFFFLHFFILYTGCNKNTSQQQAPTADSKMFS